MHRFAACLPTLVLLMAAPAVAEEYTYTYTANGFVSELYSADWPEEEGSPVYEPGEFASPSPMGETLAAVQTRLGGNIIEASDDEPLEAYLCYRSGGIRTLLLQTRDVIDWIVVEPDDPATVEFHRCTEEAAGILQLPPAIPMMGATSAAVAAWAGLQPHQMTPHETFAFVENRPPVTRDYAVRYRFTKGVVDAISLSYSEFE